MKNFLIEFFRPIDTLIFNYLVKTGGIQPFITALLGAGKAFLGSKVGGSIAGSAVSGLIGRRGQKKAQQQSRQAEARSRANLRRAFKQLRDPNDILGEAYGSEGIFGSTTQDRILGAEQRLLPGYLDLQKTQAQSQLLGEGGLMDIGQEARLRELGFMGAFAPAARGLLEDPRLAQLAGMDIAEAERLTSEAAGPLGVEAARTAEQTALGLGQRMGRTLDSSTLARAALGRESAQRERRQEASGARLRALQSSQIASIDPTALLGGLSPQVDLLSRSFLSQAPGALVTDPGQAINVGSARDVQRANVLIGQGALASQAGAARSQIAGQGYQALGSTLGGMDFSSIFGNKTPVNNFDFMGAQQSIQPRNFGFQADPTSFTGGGFNYLQR